MPAPAGRVVRELKVQVGDTVSEGTVILTLATAAASGAAATPAPVSEPASASAAPAVAAPVPTAGIDEGAFKLAHAGPAVRKLARELGVDLSKVRRSGNQGRILKRGRGKLRQGQRGARPGVAAGAGVGGIELLPWPRVDFGKFGPVESKPLSRIKKISGANLHRNWVMIPHVTNHDEADITELEAFRIQINQEIEKSGVRVSMLAFMIKAAAATLKQFPSSTPRWMATIWSSSSTTTSVRRRHAQRPGGAGPARRQSKGHRGHRPGNGRARQAGARGQAQTRSDARRHLHHLQPGRHRRHLLHPIINAPEVAIMGVCRSSWKQVSPDGKQSAWRLILPLSLSYDHRVIDGAGAARFNVHFANLLADLRRVLI